jgi:hypothetical protein
MDHDRLGAISAEMCTLLDLQADVMKTYSAPLGSMSQDHFDEYHERNQRLRDLCKELTEIT